jgi:uncharacterized membrane protein YfcA
MILSGEFLPRLSRSEIEVSERACRGNSVSAPRIESHHRLRTRQPFDDCRCDEAGVQAPAQYISCAWMEIASDVKHSFKNKRVSKLQFWNEGEMRTKNAPLEVSAKPCISFQRHHRVITTNMETTHLLPLCLAIAVVAFLYSSVGHAGASGYIAVLTLFGTAVTVIKPAALTLNILVAMIASFQFWHAGHFSWKLFWPFGLLSVPAAWLGGYLHLPLSWFKVLLGVVLLFSAVRLFLRPGDSGKVSSPGIGASMGVGACIGFLSGLTGTGGGIFLTPLLLFCRWARVRQAAAVSALFILVNSISGLAGHLSSGRTIPSFAWMLAPAAVGGGLLGSHLGSRKFPVRAIQLLLASVLVIAGVKLIFTM